jgi:sugar lactone lactonase YvrE
MAEGHRMLPGLVVVLVALALSLPAAAASAPVPLGSPGSLGAGAGQFDYPSSVASDPNGNLYVADDHNHRIDVFASDGTFIHAFGAGVNTGGAAFEVCTTASTCQAGHNSGAAGALNGPYGIALDAAGKLYVVDSNDRISVFDPAGPSFIHAFGWGVDTGAAAFEVCTNPSTCQAGTAGAGAGQINNPSGIAIDGSGALYVAEFNNDRISVFNAAGPSFTHAFGWGVDTGAAAFEVCTTASTCQAGSAGGGAGQINRPDDVATDGAGGLYVAEQNTNRIGVFDTVGPSFTRAFGWGVDTGASAFEFCTTVSTCQSGIAGANAGELNGPYGVALDGAGGLYVADGNNNRIATFGTAGPSFTNAFAWGVDTGASAFEVCTTASTCQAGVSPGSGVGQINDPEDVATDCQGASWVADSGNNRLQRFGEPGTPLCQAASPPSGGGGGGGTILPAATSPVAIPLAAIPATPRKKCKKGFVRKKVHGKKKCVRKKKK